MAPKNDGGETKSMPANDAWTGMLAISLVALIAGCVLIFLDWQNYSDKPGTFKPPAIVHEPEAKEVEPPPDAKGGMPKAAPVEKAPPAK